MLDALAHGSQLRVTSIPRSQRVKGCEHVLGMPNPLPPVLPASSETPALPDAPPTPELG